MPGSIGCWSTPAIAKRAAPGDGAASRSTCRVLELPGPDTSIDLADRDQIERGFRRLDTEQRTVLVLHYYLGLPLDEAAKVLGIPPGTVRSRLHRATAAMRAALEADARPTTHDGRTADMTARDDFDRASPEFDRLMTAWFDAEARVREPDDLLARTMSRTARKRPRPTWLLPERWIPMELTMRRVRMPRALPYLALLAVLLLVAMVALVIVGSQRRVPEPFGPARNGSIYLGTLGAEIVGIDPVTARSTTLVRGIEASAHPAISLTGTQIAFVRPEADGRHIDVVDIASGSTTRISTTPFKSIPHDLAWSPNGREVAWIVDDDLWMGKTDGSESRQLDLGMNVSDIAWRPPNGAEIVVRGAPDGLLAGLYLSSRDGSSVRPLTAIDGSEYAYIDADWSPDGTRLAYSSVPPNIVHVLTIDGLRDATIPTREGREGTLFPKWSPDGSRLAVVDWRANGDGTCRDRRRERPERPDARHRAVVHRRPGPHLVSRRDADPGPRLGNGPAMDPRPARWSGQGGRLDVAGRPVVPGR